MSERRFAEVRPGYVANLGGSVITLADPEPRQSEALQGWNTYVLDFTPYEAVALRRGADVRLAFTDEAAGTRKRQFTGTLDAIEATSEPWNLRLRAVGMLGRLRRVRQGGALDLSGMTDGEAVKAVLRECEIPIAGADIADAGYVLGQRRPVKWRNKESGLDMIQRLDEVLGAATVELGTGRVARVFYDLAPRAGAVRKVYRAGENADLYFLARDQGGMAEIANAWEVTGVEFKRPGQKGCTYVPYARARADLPRLGGGTVARQTFQSDLIQDKKLARQVVRRLMRWHNREPDSVQIEALNDPQVTVGTVVAVRDGTYGMDLAGTRRYTVMTIERTGPFMTLGCVGGDAGEVGDIAAGYEKTCNTTTTEEPEAPLDVAPEPDLSGIPDLPEAPLPDFTPWPEPTPLPAVPIELPSVDLTADPPEPCEPPCECAPPVPFVDGMQADATLGLRASGTLTLTSSAPFVFGFHGADGDYTLTVDPAFTDRAAEIRGPSGEPATCGSAPVEIGVETPWYFCWDAINKSLVGAVNHELVAP